MKRLRHLASTLGLAAALGGCASSGTHADLRIVDPGAARSRMVCVVDDPAAEATGLENLVGSELQQLGFLLQPPAAADLVVVIAFEHVDPAPAAAVPRVTPPAGPVGPRRPLGGSVFGSDRVDWSPPAAGDSAPARRLVLIAFTRSTWEILLDTPDSPADPVWKVTASAPDRPLADELLVEQAAATLRRAVGKSLAVSK